MEFELKVSIPSVWKFNSRTFKAVSVVLIVLVMFLFWLTLLMSDIIPARLV